MEDIKPLTQGVDHVGLAVGNLDLTARFFIETLRFKKVKEVPDYPAIFVSDGKILITLWQVSAGDEKIEFDRHKNIGLHHLALRIGTKENLQEIYTHLQNTPNIEIEAPPQPLGATSRFHMMCCEPGGIRIEFTTSPEE